jgi:hypothetical protein
MTMLRTLKRWLLREPSPVVVSDARNGLGPIPDVTFTCFCGSVLRLNADCIVFREGRNVPLVPCIVCPVCRDIFLAGEVYAGCPHGPWPFLRIIGDAIGIDIKRQQQHRDSQE